MKRVHNFAAGPAMLPDAVLQIAQREMLDWQNTGMSVMEVSHRSKIFMELLDETQGLLRELMQIPKQYRILFLSGGGRAQFAMVPMNVLAQNRVANYLVTGAWSKMAYQQAKVYGDIHLVADSQAEHYLTIPEPESWQVDPNARYFYYTPNETLTGVEFPYIPEVNMPLVADMTSCILSREYPVEKFGIIFAAAQKNLGQAGVTVVIIREDLLTEPLACTPSIMSYRSQAEQNSLLNTPPTYAIYIMNLILKDLQAQGGVKAIEQINQRKAKMLYDTIDASDFYKNQIPIEFRSRMNVSFNLPTVELDKKFLEQAAQYDLVNLKGHSSVGGVRASLYNAVSLNAVEALVDFMVSFAHENQK
jgi:phosphoserine aminotransferase